MNVAIIGLGYVGAVSAACFASLGHRVVGIDTDHHKANAIRSGRSPVAEPGLDDLVAEQVAAGRLTVGELGDSIGDVELILVAVGTPSAPSGALDLRAVERVCSEIGRALPQDGRYRVIAIRSTVLPGTVDTLLRPTLEAASGRVAGQDFGIATNPEFLREGSGVADFFGASRTVIGADDQASGEALARLYAEVDAPTIVVPVRVAEMAKYTDNAYHALKIAFANEIGSFARCFGVDGRAVMDVMTSDARLNISAAYLRPAYAFGGSCLPKDLRALDERARKADLDLPLLHSAMESNRAHFERGVRLVEESGGRRVAMVGLSFKPQTDDLRESPAVALAERLLGRGYHLSIFDDDVHPAALRGANRAFIEEQLPHLGELLSTSLEASVATSDVVVVTKRSPAAKRLPELLRPEHTVVDLAGIEWNPASPGHYVGIAW